MTKNSPKPTIKICHLADLHLGFRRYHKLTKLGVNLREYDVSLAFRESIDKLININPDIVLIAGDLFHTVRPSNAVITFCFKQLKRLVLNSKAEIVLLSGNHESPKRTDSGSILSLFKEIDRVFVADQNIERFSLANNQVEVVCLPHNFLSSKNDIIPEVSSKHNYNILMLHAQVDSDLRTDFGGVSLDLKKYNPERWDYIALGHVHKHQVLSYNCAYSGSIEHTSNNIWADASSKGFVELSLPENILNFIKLKSPRAIIDLGNIEVYLMEPDDVMALISERLNTVVGGIEGKIIKLDVSNINRATLQNLDYKQIRLWKSNALHFQLDFRVQNETELSPSLNKPERLSLKEDLKVFVNETIGKTDDSDLYNQKLEHYLNLVDKEYEAS
jgi:exonuclease SbcD